MPDVMTFWHENRVDGEYSHRLFNKVRLTWPIPPVLTKSRGEA